jgi:phospholipid/cholesterol/gamma-HCH transport system substrate-binding protein
VQQGLRTVNAAAENLNHFSDRVDSATSRGELQQIVTNSRTAARELADATLTLRKLADEMSGTSTKLSSTVSRADSVFVKVNSGQGTLGRMVNDPRLYQNSDSLVTELRALVADVKKNPRRYINVRVF